MIRFASAIRFVSPSEWDSLPREGLHTVESWAMQGSDQWVPSLKSETRNMAPCIASGLTRVIEPVAPNGEVTPQGIVALSHLAPIFHRYRDDAAMLLGYLKPIPHTLSYAQPVGPHLKGALGKAKLKGLMVGGYAPLEKEHVWQVLFNGMNEAIQNGTVGERLKSAFSKRFRLWGWWNKPVMPTPWPLSRKISAFVGQEDYGSSNVHYNGARDTWFILTYRKPSQESRRPHVASLEDIREHFQFRQVATDDQVYIGLNSTTPLSHSLIEAPINKVGQS